MRWILGIDSSSTELSIGIIHNNKPFVSYSLYTGNSHAEQISGAIDFIFESSGIDAADISHAGIAIGPGSFTGLRVGISFLKGLFLTHNTPVLPISSLESMAHSLNCPDCSIMTAMDARRSRVFYAKFKKENGILSRLNDDAMLDIETFSEMIGAKDTILTDNLGYRKSSVFDFIMSRPNTFSTDEITLQRGIACAYIAANSVENSSAWKKPIDIFPNYIQASYIETKPKLKDTAENNNQKSLV